MVPWGLEGASPAAINRAREDGNTYQPYHYEDPVMLWAGKDCRRPNADEWEQLFGFPRAWTDVPGLKGPPAEKELKRLRLLGNSWHLPCARFLLLSLLAALAVSTEASLLDRCFVLSVAVGTPQPVQDLFGLHGDAFIDMYISHLPSCLSTIALAHRCLFDPPETCSFLQWAIKNGCHVSGLYLPTLQEHACAWGQWPVF